MIQEVHYFSELLQSDRRELIPVFLIESSLQKPLPEVVGCRRVELILYIWCSVISTTFYGVQALTLNFYCYSLWIRSMQL